MNRTALIGLLAATGMWGQCAMCARTAQAQTEGRQRALNQGILVLLIPLAGTAAWLANTAYRRRTRTIGTGGVSDCPSAGAR